ncbi:MAG: hypothetical protein B6I24_05940 [Bacteroidetes bacterium 4572_128]|nr:MAG: hypothetical protein B6I24_05940 [Bacteroidetes bacterium 4572_128]
MLGRFKKTLLLTHPDINKLKEELKLLQKNLNQSTGDLYLQAFSKRNWELLDQLDIFVKNSNTNFALPISRHGSGTQNIATFLIFKAYINLLLKKVVSNPEAFPIIAIEEPEAHIHPQAQRELFGEIKELKGQKIISTHSIFIVEQTDIYDIVLLKNNQGISTAHQIPKFKKQLKPNLPAIAYEKNKTLNKKEESMIKRYVKYKQAEIFFSNLFILCEGDSEKLFLEQIIPYYKNKTIGQLGISVINCDGKNYTTFLKVAKLLEMNWIIFSDAEEDTKKEVKKQSKNVGFKEQKINENIIFLPKNADFEKLYIDFYGENIIKEFITEIFDKDIFQNFKNDAKEGLEKRNESKNYSEKELLNKFIDSKGKPHMAEKLANYIIKKKLEIPKVIKELIDKSYSKLS